MSSLLACFGCSRKRYKVRPDNGSEVKEYQSKYGGVDVVATPGIEVHHLDELKGVSFAHLVPNKMGKKLESRLREMVYLQSLHIQGSNVKSFYSLRNLSRLNTLKMYQVKKLSFVGVEMLLSLKTLEISNAKHPDLIYHISGCKSLKVLILSVCKFKPSDLNHLRGLNLSQLAIRTTGNTQPYLEVLSKIGLNCIVEGYPFHKVIRTRGLIIEEDVYDPMNDIYG